MALSESSMIVPPLHLSCSGCYLIAPGWYGYSQGKDRHVEHSQSRITSGWCHETSNLNSLLWFGPCKAHSRSDFVICMHVLLVTSVTMSRVSLTLGDPQGQTSPGQQGIRVTCLLLPPSLCLGLQGAVPAGKGLQPMGARGRIGGKKIP